MYPVGTSASLRPDGSVALRINCVAEIVITRSETHAFISGAEPDGSTYADEEEGSMIFRFTQGGESLWEIAKEYRVPPEEIEKANPNAFGDNGEALENSPPLLIKT